MKFNCSYDELINVNSVKLIPHVKNPNKHSKKQIERLAKLIEYQGQRLPIIISKRSGMIVSGHGRLMAIKELKWEQVAVSYQDFEDDTQEYAFLVSDNSIAEWSELDLSKINVDFPEFGPFDLDFLGLEKFEVVPDESQPSYSFKISITASSQEEANRIKQTFEEQGLGVKVKKMRA